MRFLAVDFGEKRVGLALSDPQGKLAVPLTTIRRIDDRSLILQIRNIVQRERVEALVVGEPLDLDGRRGPAAERVRRFAERLAAATGLPLRLVNESLTTAEASARLREAGVDARRHPERIDAVAAQILLQEELDRLGRAR